MSRNIYKEFLKNHHQHKNKVLLGFKNRNHHWNTLTQNQLQLKINGCVDVLRDNKIQRKDRIVYCGDNSVEWVAWNLATYAVGAVFVPIYNNQPINYVNHVISDCDPRLFITEPNSKNMHIKKVPILSNRVFDLERESFDIEKEEVATLIYTSGTTGTPKGVVLSHENIMTNIDSIKQRFYDLDKYKTLNVLPFAHIYGLTCELYYNLLNLNETYICNDKTTFVNDLKSVQPSALFLVPKILEMIKGRVEKFDRPVVRRLLPYILSYVFGSKVEIIFVGGANLDVSVVRFYQENGIVLCQGFGCTETAPLVSVNHHKDGSMRDELSVGRILEGIDVKIIKNEICVRGNNVMEGYWENPRASNKAFYVDNHFKRWYRTGDTGEVVDNFLYYKGRISENYKLANGKFVNVGEIESKIRPHLSGNFIVFSEDGKSNQIIAEDEISEVMLRRINDELDRNVKITGTYRVDENLMQTRFLTPKLSIKRNKLIEHVLSIKK